MKGKKLKPELKFTFDVDIDDASMNFEIKEEEKKPKTDIVTIKKNGKRNNQGLF